MIDIVGMLISKLIERPLNSVFGDLWPRLDEQSLALARIERRQEADQVAPLLAAQLWLRLGKPDKVVESLVTAESQNVDAPVVKLALAPLYGMSGKSPTLYEHSFTRQRS